MPIPAAFSPDSIRDIMLKELCVVGPRAICDSLHDSETGWLGFESYWHET